MKKTWALVPLAFLLVALLVTAALAIAWMALPLEGTMITYDGNTYTLSALSGWHAVGVIAATLAVVFVVLVLVAAAVLIVLTVAALGSAVGVIASVASLALIVAPFAFVGWAVWRMVRRRPQSNRIAT